MSIRTGKSPNNTLDSSSVQPPLLLTMKQATERLNVSLSTLERMISKGVIPLIRLGPDGPKRIRTDHIDRLLNPAPDTVQPDNDDLITNTIKEG